MKGKPSVNRNINSAPLYLFNKVSEQVLVLVYLTQLIYFLLNIITKLYKKKLFISIKHVLIIGRDMPETRHQKIFKKNLDKSKILIFHIFDLKNNLNIKLPQQLQVVLRATQSFDVLILFKKIFLSSVRSEIHPVRRNIVSTRQSVQA